MIANDVITHPDTIVAIATAPGKGGVGIVRVSGPKCTDIARALIGQLPSPRQAVLSPFYHPGGEIIDTGLVLYFPNPHSFTGEDVLELHAHGGPVVLDMLVKAILQCGAIMARPGEFSQRAFLNGKMDLTQVEAVADLIDAGTQEAALSASRSLQGVFSSKIETLSKALMSTRMFVEATLDFPDEEIDFLSDKRLLSKIEDIRTQIDTLLSQAKVGQLLKEGMTVVIVGRPNAGKSSLLNCLTQYETAIVTPIAGTTRDLIKETIHIDGLPLHIVDTAGIREDADVVEQEGIKRAKHQLSLADRILLVIDADNALTQIEEEILAEFPNKVTLIFNKIDLMSHEPRQDNNAIHLSAKTGQGIDLLRAHLKQCMGYQGTETGVFIARRRHLHALERTEAHFQEALAQLVTFFAFEKAAEELRLAQNALGEIVGVVTTEDVLGEIFSHFCIGK